VLATRRGFQENAMNEIPSQDPADDDSLAGVLNSCFRKMLLAVDGMLPAEIVSYDRVNNIATVRPLIQVMSTSGATTSRAVLASVPVLALGGGNYVINFPLKAGDKGWIEASDRDISLFMQAQAEARPNTLRLHSFSDGRFIPDVFGQYQISDDGAMVIQTLDGSTKIVVSEDTVTIDTAKDIVLNAAATITLTAPQINLNGNLSMGGGAGAATINSATLNIQSETSIQGRDFMEHQHPDSVGGTTGGVI
jgi:hypothetical protein